MKLIEPIPPQDAPLLLAVDDQPENLKLLGNTLEKEGIALAFALSASDALTWLEEHEPDLILLDVAMPGMDGLECCRQIKSLDKFEHTPVIFLTARVETSDIEAGFLAGAVDYVTKPFHASELIARVRTHLRLQQQRQDLEHLLKQKSELIGIIAHDVRNPIASISSLAALLLDPDSDELDENPEETLTEFLSAMKECADNALNTLSELLNAKFNRSGQMQPNMKPVSLPEIYESVKVRNAGQAMRKKIELVFGSEGSPAVYADPVLLTEVLDNLVSNSIKYSPEQTTVAIQTGTALNGGLQLIVSDEGPGFEARDYDRLFQRNQRLSARPTGGESSFGLGLAHAKELMDAQGGSIALISRPNESARFLLRFSERP
ncbi:MAG: hybrid sensor histidine kinase/response regulator [Verrucomicrobiota bacterium JB024]|nr:hybrid sensor histidine kinase/response regulator [Verrucomicrobiota bacterium JB024]